MIFLFALTLFAVVICEILLQFLIRFFRKDFQWLITEKDDYPIFDQVAFDKFILNSFDKELGWVKKPNSIGTEKGKNGKIIFHIDDKGSRENFVDFKTSIVTFGDSYTFCKQVEDNQTWQACLSKNLDDKVLNYGVGNYGIDQAFLYYKRQKLPETTKIVILGFVPETICRIQSYWKHYLEFGNIFAFKPRFSLDNGQLKLHDNLINCADDFNKLHKIIDKVKINDGFYTKKFRQKQFRFPYLLRYFFNFKSTSLLLYFLIKKKLFNLIGFERAEINNAPFSKIMFENISDSHKMYRDDKACELLEAILMKFCNLANKRGHKPLLLIMPQLMDLKINKKQKTTPYAAFFSKINKITPVLDMTPHLNGKNLNSFYTDDLYGGHFSEIGNELVAEKVLEFIKSDYFNKL
jgi:hypothetical protein